MKFLFVSLIFLLSFSNSLAKIAESLIIPKFYEILLSKENPIQQDENDFFGGDECSAVREFLIQDLPDPKSKTPIWDFLRKNKSIFFTKNILNFDDARIVYSDPFRMTRMWNKRDRGSKYVYATFATKVREDNLKAHQGLSMILFTLGEKCYLVISETNTAGSCDTFLDYLYGMKKS
jgi:hypothetical protein